jgi:hypothetical protein
MTTMYTNATQVGTAAIMDTALAVTHIKDRADEVSLASETFRASYIG